MCSFFFKKVEPAVVVVCGDIVQEEERHLLNGWRSLEETVSHSTTKKNTYNMRGHE